MRAIIAALPIVLVACAAGPTKPAGPSAAEIHAHELAACDASRASGGLAAWIRCKADADQKHDLAYGNNAAGDLVDLKHKQRYLLAEKIEAGEISEAEGDVKMTEIDIAIKEIVGDRYHKERTRAQQSGATNLQLLGLF